MTQPKHAKTKKPARPPPSPAGGKTCQAPCTPPCARTKLVAHGLCVGHYGRKLRGKSLAQPLFATWRAGKICTAPCTPPCTRPVAYSNLCNPHQLRKRQGKGIDIHIPRLELASNKGKRCSSKCKPRCEKPAFARTWCEGHYSRWRQNKPVDTPLLLKMKRGSSPKHCTAPCKPRCPRETYLRGLCVTHYHRQWRGDPIDRPVTKPGHRSVKSG